MIAYTLFIIIIFFETITSTIKILPLKEEIRSGKSRVK